MTDEARDTTTDKNATGAIAAAQEGVSDLAKQGQQMAQDVDKQLEDYTGRSSEAWLNEGARLIKAHPWKAVTALAILAYVLGKRRG